MADCPKVLEYPPKWYASAHYLIGIIIIPVSSYTYFVINKITISHVDKLYTKYLNFHHLWVTAGSLHNTLSITVSYMPATLAISLGFLSINPLWDIIIDATFQVFITVLGSVLALHRMLLCLYGKHVPKYTHLIAACYSFICGVTYPSYLIFFGIIYDKEESYDLLRKICPEFIPLTEKYFVMFSISYHIQSINNVLILTCVITGAASTIFLYYSYTYLMNNSLNISKKTKQLQFRLLLSITLQLAVPATLQTLPGLYFAVIVTNNTAVPLGASLLTWSFGSFDAIFNSFILLYLNPSYKARAKIDLNSLLFCSKQPPRAVVISRRMPSKY